MRPIRIPSRSWSLSGGFLGSIPRIRITGRTIRMRVLPLWRDSFRIMFIMRMNSTVRILSFWVPVRRVVFTRVVWFVGIFRVLIGLVWEFWIMARVVWTACCSFCWTSRTCWSGSRRMLRVMRIISRITAPQTFFFCTWKRIYILNLVQGFIQYGKSQRVLKIILFIHRVF